MRLITKNTDYAVRALVVLARKPGAVLSAKQIAEEQSIPYQYLRRILNILIKSKFVVSREGIGGGFKLVVPSAKIRLVDIMEIFQGEVKLADCMFRKKLCLNRGSCLLRSRIIRIEEIVRKEFDHITIRSLLR